MTKEQFPMAPHQPRRDPRMPEPNHTAPQQETPLMANSLGAYNATFAAQDHAPGSGSSAQDIDAGTLPIRLDRHKEVKFAVSDRDLAYASERIIDDHLRPAAYALADSIDQDL